LPGRSSSFSNRGVRRGIALTRLFLEHHDSLQSHLQQELGKAAAGMASEDDILQQTFVRAAQTIGRLEFRGDGSFQAWLKTIATNLVKDARKRRLRERRATARADALAGDRQ
jgi:DNA-directed RNA polymerase specialized sigma24 family protein